MRGHPSPQSHTCLVRKGSPIPLITHLSDEEGVTRLEGHELVEVEEDVEEVPRQLAPLQVAECEQTVLLLAGRRGEHKEAGGHNQHCHAQKTTVNMQTVKGCSGGNICWITCLVLGGVCPQVYSPQESRTTYFATTSDFQ